MRIREVRPPIVITRPDYDRLFNLIDSVASSAFRRRLSVGRTAAGAHCRARRCRTDCRHHAVTLHFQG